MWQHSGSGKGGHEEQTSKHIGRAEQSRRDNRKWKARGVRDTLAHKQTETQWSANRRRRWLAPHTQRRYVTYRPAVSLGRTMRTTCPRCIPK